MKVGIMVWWRNCENGKNLSKCVSKSWLVLVNLSNYCNGDTVIFIRDFEWCNSLKSRTQLRESYKLKWLFVIKLQKKVRLDQLQLTGYARVLHQVYSTVDVYLKFGDAYTEIFADGLYWWLCSLENTRSQTFKIQVPQDFL